jgi:hypothetical protein
VQEHGDDDPCLSLCALYLHVFCRQKLKVVRAVVPGRRVDARSQLLEHVPDGLAVLLKRRMRPNRNYEYFACDIYFPEDRFRTPCCTLWRL